MVKTDLLIKQKRAETNHNYILTHSHRKRATTTLNAHKRKGYAIKVTHEEVTLMFENTTHCPICGCELKRTRDGKGASQTSPSLDRIDNGVELRKDNLWVICYRCNALKGDMSMKEYVERSRMIVEKFGDD